jgi:hypothetical protein
MTHVGFDYYMFENQSEKSLDVETLTLQHLELKDPRLIYNIVAFDYVLGALHARGGEFSDTNMTKLNKTTLF